jgi:hypothetical protein
MCTGHCFLNNFLDETALVVSRACIIAEVFRHQPELGPPYSRVPTQSVSFSSVFTVSTLIMAECYWSKEIPPIIHWPSLDIGTHTENRVMSSGQTDLFNIVTIVQ